MLEERPLKEKWEEFSVLRLTRPLARIFLAAYPNYILQDSFGNDHSVSSIGRVRMHLRDLNTGEMVVYRVVGCSSCWNRGHGPSVVAKEVVEEAGENRCPDCGRLID